MRFSLKTTLAIVFITALVSLSLRAYLESRPLDPIPYSKGALDSGLAEGRCVIITIYANWDPITADRSYLFSRDVIKRIRGKNMLVMDADWTQQSANIRLLTQELSITTVPVLVFYDPTTPKNPTVITGHPAEIDVLKAIEACCD